MANIPTLTGPEHKALVAIAVEALEKGQAKILNQIVVSKASQGTLNSLTRKGLVSWVGDKPEDAWYSVTSKGLQFLLDTHEHKFQTALRQLKQGLGKTASGNILYHGTTEQAAQQILRSGFDRNLAGLRQKTLHGEEVAEIRGVYVTSELRRAEWYAGGLRNVGSGGGVVLKLQVSGRIMPENEYWKLKREVNEEMGLQSFDPRAQKAVDEVVKRVKAQGFIGIQENDEEAVIFDLSHIKVLEATYGKGPWWGSPFTKTAGLQFPKSLAGKPGVQVTLPEASWHLWTEDSDSDEAFPPVIRSYEVVDGWLVYHGRNGSEGIMVGSKAELDKWLSQVDHFVKEYPPEHDTWIPWTPDMGGAQLVAKAKEVAQNVLKDFGKNADVRVWATKSKAVSGDAGGNALNLINVHLGGDPVTFLGNIDVPQHLALAVHEAAHLGFSQGGMGVVQALKEYREAGGPYLTEYHSLSGSDMEGAMEAAVLYVMAPEKFKTAAPAVYEAVAKWFGGHKVKTASGTIPILLDVAKTQKFRTKYPGFKHNLVVGKFMAPIRLYRVFDQDEADRLLFYRTGDIKGGTYAVPAEREMGASWASSLREALDFGVGWKARGRLKGQLYVAEIEGDKKGFIHLAPEIDPPFEQAMLLDPPVATMHTDNCSGGLGCSVKSVRVPSVKQWYRVDETGKAEPVSFDEMEREARETREWKSMQDIYGVSKTAGKLTKEWLNAVQGAWNHLLDNATLKVAEDYRRIFKSLFKFLDNLEQQIRFQHAPILSAKMDSFQEKLDEVRKVVDGLEDIAYARADEYQFARDKYDAGYEDEYGPRLEQAKKRFFDYADKDFHGDLQKLAKPFEAMLSPLYEDVANNEGPGYTSKEEFTDFSLYGAKVVVDDRTIEHPADVQLYIRYLDKAYLLLKSHGFEDLWKGTFLIRGENSGPGSIYGGPGMDYSENTDAVRIFTRPKAVVTELAIHELAHRYWFKNMNTVQRGHFVDLIQSGEIKAVSEYGATQPKEAFAEAVAYAVQGKDMTRDQVESLRAVISDRTRRVAGRYLGQRTAGIFEAPPVMLKAAEDWMLRIYCGNILAKVERQLESTRGGAGPVQEAIAEMQKAKDTLRKKMDAMEPGDSVRVPLYTASKVGGGVKVRAYIGARWQKLSSDYTRIFKNGDGPNHHRIVSIDDIPEDAVPMLDFMVGTVRMTNQGKSRPLEEMYETLKDLIDGAVADLERADQRQPTSLSPQDVVEFNLMRRECLKYTSKAVEYAAKASTRIPVDVTGWQYAKAGSPIIEKVNKARAEERPKLKALIEKSETAFENAQKVYDAMQAGDKEAESKYMALLASSHSTNADPFWIRWEVYNAEKRPSENFAWYRQVKTPIAVLKEKLQHLRPLEPQEITEALQSDERWDSIKLVLDFQGHTKRGGQWELYAKTLQVDAPRRRLSDMPDLQEVIGEIRRITRHEMQHVGQDLLQEVLELKENAGLPPKGIRDPSVTPEGNPTEGGRARIEHPLRDVEFQTRLADEVTRFVKHVKTVRRSIWSEQLKAWVGEKVTAGNVAPQAFFTALKKAQPDKWRKAVTEFTKAVEQQVGTLKVSE